MEKGWIYCITNPIYKNENLYKIGMTSQKGFEDEIKKKLLQRYKTTFIEPELLFLKNVYYPRKVEKEILDILFEHRNKNSEMINADYINIIKPKLNEITIKYINKNDLMTINLNEYLILNNKLNNKFTILINKLLKDNNYYSIKRHSINLFINNYISSKKLHENNISMLYQMNNIINNLQPPYYRCSNIYSKDELLKIKMWKNDIIMNFNILLNNSYKSDPNLYIYLKDLSKLL